MSSTNPNLQMYFVIDREDEALYAGDKEVRRIGSKKFAPCLGMSQEEIKVAQGNHAVGEPFRSANTLWVVLPS